MDIFTPRADLDFMHCPATPVAMASLFLGFFRFCSFCETFNPFVAVFFLPEQGCV